VLDAGAHWGYFTLLAAKHAGPDGFVVAFEPDPRSLERLRWNVRANGFEQRTRVVHAALGSAAGAVPLFTHPTYHSWTSLYPLEGGVAERSVKVVAAADELAGQRPFDVVKIDVEGAEVEAIRGMREILRGGRPMVFVECNPPALERAGATVDDLLGELRALGYDVQAIDERDGSLRGVREALAQAQFVNLVCSPA
jgi:FkbM family methyltransferase